jgi:hypothetical protein
MSFRLFIYYCTVCGGCAAYLGWALGRLITAAVTVGDFIFEKDVWEMGLEGLALGLLLSFGLAVMDSAWNLSLARIPAAILRVIFACVVGTVGGLIGGLIGQWLFDKWNVTFLMVFGWTFTGFLIGISLGVFDNVAAFALQKNVRGAVRKLINVIIGGTIGGAVGGILSVLLGTGLYRLIKAPIEPGSLWSPSAIGFVVLGMCIGLMIAVAQVILREAWIKIEVGKRQGKQLILQKQETTIGRAESCELGLFGDSGIERQHARLVQEGNGYLLVDLGTPGGTFINGERVDGPTRLQSGDRIQVGQTILRFSERRKR